MSKQQLSTALCNAISLVIFKVDAVLYKTFNIVSSFRRHHWVLSGKRLQRDLDREHSMRDHLNAFNGTSYTTKQALALRED